LGRNRLDREVTCGRPEAHEIARRAQRLNESGKARKIDRRRCDRLREPLSTEVVALPVTDRVARSELDAPDLVVVETRVVASPARTRRSFTGSYVSEWP
jgi:hypothetical protein